MSLVDALQGVLDLAGEPRCVSCQGFAAGVLCHACQERCEPVPGPTCPRCGSAPTEGAPDAACGRCQRFGRAFAFERALAVWSYAGPVRRAVLAFKFGGRPDAARQLGRAMANWPTLGAWLVGLPDALVVPVPARRAARRWRGYDQAALLARGLAGAAGRACDGRALARRREPAAPQAGRPLAERRAGPRAGFVARPERVAGRAIVLVDDVLSSGATVDAASRALLCAGATRVVVMALAT